MSESNWQAATQVYTTDTMRAYIAAPYPEKAAAAALRVALLTMGVGCTSRWLTDPNETLNAEWAANDLDDVRDATLLIALNPDGWAERGTGGRHVELGYALAWDKPIYLVGDRTNIFHFHENVRQFATCDALLRDLGARTHVA